MLKGLLKLVNIPTSKAEFLISNVAIAHMIEGRIRVVYSDIKTNDNIYNQVTQTLSNIDEITSFKINRVTGSITIEYDEQTVRKNKFLVEFLQLAKQKYRRYK